jgi:hypothetical protein
MAHQCAELVFSKPGVVWVMQFRRALGLKASSPRLPSGSRLSAVRVGQENSLVQLVIQPLVILRIKGP